MKPEDDYRNGDAHSLDEDSSGEEADALEAELSLVDEDLPRRALLALNALRKSRQHYDALLLAGGAEVPAHRAVLGAASPHLLHALEPHAPTYRVEGVEADALRELVEYAYTGRLVVREPGAARRLYVAAGRLRMEAARAHLAERLLRHVQPATSVELRALPDLSAAHVGALDAYVARHFAAVCATGALNALPQVRLDVMRATSSAAGEEAAGAVAGAALAWLRDQTADLDLEQLCARTHLVYVDAGGALRDCGDLPPARGDAPALTDYRREAAARGRAARRGPAPAPAACSVVAACRSEGGGRATRALVQLGGRLAAVHVGWHEGGAGCVGGPLGGGEAGEGARLGVGRAALGAVALGGALLALGGYERSRVLAGVERWRPGAGEWAPLGDMRGPRARFPALAHEDTVYVIGGSDGHNELDTMDSYRDGTWRLEARLPLALSHAAAALDLAELELLVVGGWAGGLALRQVHRYCLRQRAWAPAPPLRAARSQCAGAHWRGALWALGGCDNWHCLASTELLRRGGDWEPGPALPAPRRSAGAAVWRGALLLAGGSDGSASLRRTDLLPPGAGDDWGSWRAGPGLRRARAGLGLVALGEALYAVGGFDGKEFLSCVECLYQLDGEWTALSSAPPPPPSLASPPSPPTEEETQ